MNNAMTGKKVMIEKNVIHFKFPKRVLDCDMPYILAGIDRCRSRKNCKKVFRALVMFDKNENKPVGILREKTGLGTKKIEQCINELISNGLIEINR